jgi:hypothetical protein
MSAENIHKWNLNRCDSEKLLAAVDSLYYYDVRYCIFSEVDLVGVHVVSRGGCVLNLLLEKERANS